MAVRDKLPHTISQAFVSLVVWGEEALPFYLKQIRRKIMMRGLKRMNTVHKNELKSQEVFENKDESVGLG